MRAWKCLRTRGLSSLEEALTLIGFKTDVRGLIER
jgi:hypothetical protein